MSNNLHVWDIFYFTAPTLSLSNKPVTSYRMLCGELHRHSNVRGGGNHWCRGNLCGYVGRAWFFIEKGYSYLFPFRVNTHSVFPVRAVRCQLVCFEIISHVVLIFFAKILQIFDICKNCLHFAHICSHFFYIFL